MMRAIMCLEVVIGLAIAAIHANEQPEAKEPYHVHVESTLPLQSHTYGAWMLTSEDADYHVYASHWFAVIGHNRNHTDKFSAMALGLNRDGTASMQYRGDDGEAVIVDLPLPVVQKHLDHLLESLKLEAQARKR